METCYHFTNKKKLEQILNEGLRPIYGINSQLISDSRNARIYYSIGEETTIMLFKSFHSIIGRVLYERISLELYETYSD